MKTLSHKVVTARKKHTCDWCLSTIRPGEQYHTSFNVDSGEGYTWKSHVDCLKLVEIMLGDDNDGEGMTMDDFDTYLYESYQEITGEPHNNRPYDEILTVVKNKLLGTIHDGKEVKSCS